MTGKSDSLTREDALAYLRRFPAQGRLATAFNFALVLSTNGVVFWLLASGRLRSAALIALVMAETILLIVVARAAASLVPRRDWQEPPKTWREQLPIIGFVLVWLGFAYGMTLVVIDGYRDFFALLSRPRAWVEAGLHWPLMLTAATALVHAVGDVAHYRRHGAPYISSTSHDALARYLTLLLGAIPFAMPFFAVAIGGFKAVEYLAKRLRVAPGESVLFGVAMLGVACGSFGLISLLIDGGVGGWAIGYVFAKLIAELGVAAVPLVMAHVAKHGP